MSLGASPRALAKRARRERPMWARRPESRSNRSTQAGLNGDLPSALSRHHAARLYRRQEVGADIGKRLAVMPDRHRVDGSEPSADRSHIERNGGRLVSQQDCDPFHRRTRSRRRVAVSLPSRSRAASTSARVTGSAAGGAGALLFGFPAHGFLLSGASGLVPSGLGRTGGDGSGNSGILLHTDGGCTLYEYSRYSKRVTYQALVTGEATAQTLRFAARNAAMSSSEIRTRRPNRCTGRGTRLDEAAHRARRHVEELRGLSMVRSLVRGRPR